MKISTEFYERLFFGAVLAAVVVLEFLYLWTYQENNPHFAVATMDSAIYVNWAGEINRDG